jgi:hypothetical protein
MNTQANWAISIEGSVIIIATCIPTLQPLLELIRGRTLSTDSSSRRAYMKQGSSRSGRQDIELAPKVRIRTPQDELAGIMDTRHDKADSQESILGPINPPNEPQPSVERTGSIMRTQEVSIMYGPDEPPPRSNDHPANWRPMRWEGLVWPSGRLWVSCVVGIGYLYGTSTKPRAMTRHKADSTLISILGFG